MLSVEGSETGWMKKQKKENKREEGKLKEPIWSGLRLPRDEGSWGQRTVNSAFSC